MVALRVFMVSGLIASFAQMYKTYSHQQRILYGSVQECHHVVADLPAVRPGQVVVIREGLVQPLTDKEAVDATAFGETYRGQAVTDLKAAGQERTRS